MKDRRLIGLLIILAIVIVNMGVVSASDGNSSYYEIPDDVDTISDTIAIENKTFEAIDYAIWQYTSEGSVPGITGEVDLDMMLDYSVIKK